VKGPLAFVLIAVGAIVASLGVAATDPSVEGWIGSYQVNTALGLAGLIVLSVGIGVRRSATADARREQADGGNLQAAADALEKMVTATNAVVAKLDSISDHDELHGQLDEIVSGPVTDFVDNRQSITDTFGLAAYASVMSSFSRGERYLNRAWSASTDGYLEEAAAYVRRAGPVLDEARRLFRELDRD